MLRDVCGIIGLVYIPEFIDRNEESFILSMIDGQPWKNDLRRRVQHYGYRYDYKARAVPSDAWLGPLPVWIQSIAQKLHAQELFGRAPDQAIVNEYLPGQGISAHIDCIPCFGPVLAVLSLESPVIMQLSSPESGQRREMLLEERSLLVLSGSARYEWLHAIPPRKSDIVDGMKMQRRRRVSLTFRTTIVSI